MFISVIKHIFLNFFRFWVSVPDGTFFGTTIDKPTDWVHTVLNFLGPDQGLGIYHNGEYVTNIISKSAGKHNPNIKGNIVLGRIWTDSDVGYSSIDVDELYFFNRILTTTEIRQISQTAG